MKTIKVVKITLESYSALIELGYNVKFVNIADKPPVFANYLYTKTINTIRCGYTNKPNCSHFTCIRN